MNKFREYLGTKLLTYIEGHDPFESALDAGLIDEIIEVSDVLLGDCDYEDSDVDEDIHDAEPENFI